MTKPPDLFEEKPAIGILKGFSPQPHQLEVDVVVPFVGDGLPGFGEFLLIELNSREALVGRVSRYFAAGQLVSERGDAYLADMAQNQEKVPEGIMRQSLRYNLKIQLLGHLAADSRGGLKFSVGERGFATLGSNVRRPSALALAYLCNVGLENDPTATPLGHLVYGQHVNRDVPVKFSVNRLKGRRSFVFARAGYGKSNLIKYLLSQLYLSPPDVGLLIFDPEGEYALPDAHGRSGLVNVPGLEKRMSLYTNRTVPESYRGVYRDKAQIDFGNFPPQDIIAAVVPSEKQDMVSMNLLRGLKWDSWRELVKLLDEEGYKADDKHIASILGYKARQADDVVIGAIKNNILPAIRRLHKPGVKLGKNIIEELRQNRVVIIDTSLLPGEDSLAVTGLLMRRVFNHNLRHFTEINGPTVRCLAVLEEAQTMLGDRRLDDRDVFVRWVKEGRKYGLGCILVTQQPGSISNQIISQGDNFFVLHLLNEGDLQILQRHNAYFSNEILGFIRNEPIPGNCYFWSAPNQPFVLPARIFDFESVCSSITPGPAGAESVQHQRTEHNPTLRDAIVAALRSNPRVWLYPVKRIAGTEASGLVACSADYLRGQVSLAMGHRGNGDEFDAVMRELNALSGYAVLEGVTRPVWVLKQSKIKPATTKKIQPAEVEVTDSL